ncbi:hypothetical protein KZ686_19650 [Cupriavidus cauae]|uniref:Uncharacterized protein n=1 Tax=Cupriavidus cauae TaxID=2608999 RepID=A0A5M8B1R7_9BURK|nr:MULTISPECIES: hypothetical protein [Cupriavidus]KAA0180483.1 hypothetical protein FX016_15110 [Cupriavidus gilardii]KAA6129767.1 hypothetical protein F1599_04335 [Cupriavidus cauae]MCA7083800.1 hypothetical protein [Cupriavidus sp. DB3]UZN52279.1 hypothetical protein KZ686_19650 [Cupriavidus cauae]
MERLFKPLTELKRILARQLREQPGCHDCQLRAVCVHRPDHTGCNWSAEVDFPERCDDDAVRDLRHARQVIMLVRERYNVTAASLAGQGGRAAGATPA